MNQMKSLNQHLLDRHCKAAMYNNSLVLDEDNRVVTFLLWNLSGQLVGYQQYRPDCTDKATKNNPEKRYYTFLGEEGDENKARKRLGVFGIEMLKRGGRVFLTEGIFDACRFHYYGFPALALLSNNPKPLKSFLSMLNRELIAVCDGDDGGKKLAKYGDIAVHCPKGKDVSDLTNDEFNKIIRKGLDYGKNNINCCTSG